MQTDHTIHPLGMPPGNSWESTSSRQNSIYMVLDTLERHQPISRTELAHLTGMSPTSITRIISELINQSIVCETSQGVSSRRGRRAINLCIHADGMYAVGIWLDKSIIRLCLINLAQEILYRSEALIDGPCIPERMAEEARRLFDRIPLDETQLSRIMAIGVCMSGALNPRTGIVRTSSLLSWENVDIRSLLQAQFSHPVYIENDVKARLIGEKARMHLGNQMDVACLLVSSGIGLAVSCGATMIRGADNEAGEITHLPSHTAKINCFCGRSNCLRLHLAETALLQRARMNDPSIRSIEAILWSMRQGENWAIELIDDFILHLRTTLAVIDGMYNPSMIVLGGTIFHQLSDELTDLLADDHVCLGDPNDDTCIIGAALVALQYAVLERLETGAE